MSKAAVDQTFETVSEVNSSLLLHLRNIILPALLRGSAFDCFRRSKEPFQAAPFHGDSSSELLILICCFSACLNLCDPMDCSTSGFAVLHYFPKFAQSHVHWVSDAIQPSHSLCLLYPLVLNLSQHQSLFHWVSSLNQVAEVLELQHQSFQWTFRVDFL